MVGLENKPVAVDKIDGKAISNRASRFRYETSSVLHIFIKERKRNLSQVGNGLQGREFKNFCESNRSSRAYNALPEALDDKHTALLYPGEMPNNSWTDEENDLIVADYFAMLANDLAAQPSNKAKHRRALVPLLQNRSEDSIKFKHRNISAVLKALGEDWISSYHPAFNFQKTLIDAVVRRLALHPNWPSQMPGIREEAQLWGVGPAPRTSNQPPPEELKQMARIAQKFDVARRDERNRALGRAGEEFVLAHERAVLKAAGQGDLAREVRWTSEEDGDGAGYDIASFTPDGQSRLIEVKTTKGWERTPFYITRNELAVADERRSEWCLFRLWNFSRGPRAFELRPPLDEHVLLTPTTFTASFH